MKRRGMRIPFECITRADRLNATHGRDARGAGLLARLDRLRERIATDSRRHAARRHRGAGARRRLRSAGEHGIQTGMFLMWGYEGEEISDIEATVDT